MKTQEVTKVATGMLWFFVLVVVVGIVRSVAKHFLGNAYEVFGREEFWWVVVPSLVIIGIMRTVVWLYQNWNK